jgi:hypothetical protein
MKKKDLKNIAQKIAVAQMRLETTTDKAEIADLQAEIMRYTEMASESIDDLIYVDEQVQKIISKNN